LPISVRINGRLRRLPAGVDLAAYRIIQEALTNVTRHAPGAPTDVHVNYTERELVLDVQNDAPSATNDANGSGGTGKGIRGMRERVAALGGLLDVGPHAAGGFRVHAELPLGSWR
jgi:signal transduction histidine kinase